ncbi:MAG: peptidylprolyl isomerase [Planctomycetes bacterium]|jgi:peptidyl-prolyl cis-trans isomerase A (cyclophilin A)|nr:peptidylprolyl isomerase [Planctomycetota bacterium]
MSKHTLALFLVLIALAACQKKGGEPAKTPATPAPPGAAATEEPTVPFLVKLETTCGDIVVKVHPDWAPIAAKRFKELVKIGFYDGCRFFRVAKGFVVQFGINGDPTLNSRWAEFGIRDEPVKVTNRKGTLTFAMSSAPNSRTTQLFFNMRDNSGLDPRGFAPFAEVVEGWDTVERINPKYGEQPSAEQGRINAEGNAFLDAAYPGLDHIRKATILP